MTPPYITLCDGKYTLIMDPSRMRALRYGKPWRELIGDGFVMALGHEILELREKLSAGVSIDIKDRHGDPVHVGDTLRFDTKEWGSPHTYVVKLKAGEILVDGVASDIPEYCEILTKFDGRMVRL